MLRLTIRNVLWLTVVVAVCCGYRLSTLMIVLALGPPVLAVLWFLTHSIHGMVAWAAFVGFFVVWHWQLRKWQEMHPRSRGDWSV